MSKFLAGAIRKHADRLLEQETEHAMRIAESVHREHFRKDGVTPYMEHVNAVVDGVPDFARPAAYLHDVLEKNPKLYGKLKFDFTHPTFDAVLALTKKDGERYEDYIYRVSRNSIARLVKIADIRHNLSGSPSEKRKHLYAFALDYLNAETKLRRSIRFDTA